MSTIPNKKIYLDLALSYYAPPPVRQGGQQTHVSLVKGDFGPRAGLGSTHGNKSNKSLAKKTVSRQKS